MSDAPATHGLKRSKDEATSSNDGESGHEDKQCRTIGDTGSSSGFDGFDSDEDGFDDTTFDPITNPKGKERGSEESLSLFAQMEAAEAARAAKLATEALPGHRVSALSSISGVFQTWTTDLGSQPSDKPQSSSAAQGTSDDAVARARVTILTGLIEKLNRLATDLETAQAVPDDLHLSAAVVTTVNDLLDEKTVIASKDVFVPLQKILFPEQSLTAASNSGSAQSGAAPGASAVPAAGDHVFTEHNSVLGSKFLYLWKLTGKEDTVKMSN